MKSFVTKVVKLFQNITPYGKISYVNVEFTGLGGVTELAEENTEVTVQDSEKVYRFNLNEKMNRLNIKSLLLTRQHEKGGWYDFDYDNISTGSITVRSSTTGNTMHNRRTVTQIPE